MSIIFHWKTWIFIFILFITILFNMLSLEYSSLFLIIFAGLLFGVIIILLEIPGEFDSIFFLFVIGFLIRILTSIFLYFSMSILQEQSSFLQERYGGFFLGDGYAYSLNGWNISQLWRVGINVNKANLVSQFGSASGTVGNYDFLNAIIYSLFGYNPFNLFFINCLAGSLAIVLIFIISSKIFNRKVAMISSLLCTFWPSFILWSSQNIKDPLTNLGMLFFLYFLFKLRHSLNFSIVLFLFFSIMSIYYLRFLCLIPLIISSFIYFLFSSNMRMIIKSALIIFIIISFLFFSNQLLPKKFSGLDIFQLIDRLRSDRAYGKLSYFPNFKITSLGRLLAYLPLGIFAVWFSPFPWQIFSLNQLLSAPEILVWYIFLPFGIKGIWLALKYRLKDSYLLMATIGTFTLFLAVYEGNVGTLFRHKAIVTTLMFVFISFGFHSKFSSGELSCRYH